MFSFTFSNFKSILTYVWQLEGRKLIELSRSRYVHILLIQVVCSLYTLIQSWCHMIFFPKKGTWILVNVLALKYYPSYQILTRVSHTGQRISYKSTKKWQRKQKKTKKDWSKGDKSTYTAIMRIWTRWNMPNSVNIKPK